MSNAMQLALAKLSSQTILTAEEAEAFLEICGRGEKVEGGAVFVHKEQEVNSACLLVEGIVARTVVAISGSRQITAFYVPGDIPDLHSLMQPRVTSALRAVTECRIIRISHVRLAQAVSEFPGLMEAFWRYAVWDAAVATEWVVNVGKRPGPQRVAHLLCELAVRTGQPQEGEFSFELPLTQGVLADAAGISAVHVNRSLQQLRKKNLIQIDKATVTIPYWQQLVMAAEFNDAYLGPKKPLRVVNENQFMQSNAS